MKVLADLVEENFNPREEGFMKIEYDARVPAGAKRFKCERCGSQYLAEEEGIDWFEKNRPKYLDVEYISYCPICGKENKQ